MAESWVIRDIKGTLVNPLMSRAIHQSGNHKLEFNVGHLLDGAYTIRLSGEKGILTKPLIVSE